MMQIYPVTVVVYIDDANISCYSSSLYRRKAVTVVVYIDENSDRRCRRKRMMRATTRSCSMGENPPLVLGLARRVVPPSSCAVEKRLIKVVARFRKNPSPLPRAAHMTTVGLPNSRLPMKEFCPNSVMTSLILVEARFFLHTEVRSAMRRSRAMMGLPSGPDTSRRWCGTMDSCQPVWHLDGSSGQ